MTRAGFATLEQFSRARVDVSEVCLPPDRSTRLQFNTGGCHWFLVVEAGRVRDWDLGQLGDADVEIRWSTDDGRNILRGDLRGDDALLATTVFADAGGTTYTGTPAPLNLACRPELASMPVAPGATFRVQYGYRDGPFGAVSYALSFEDGRLVEERLGVVDGAHVTVDVTYRAMALVRAGEISIIDALEDGSVSGDLGPLAALAGISESPEFHAAELGTGRHALALAVLGELNADSRFAAAMKALGAGTSDA